MGISGLETALGLALTVIDIETAVATLTIAPVRSLSLDTRIEGLGTLGAGAPGDVTIIDPNAEWMVDPALFVSKGKNTPLAGRTLRGKVTATVYGGKVVWRA
jgi:dihydroorotase